MSTALVLLRCFRCERSVLFVIAIADLLPIDKALNAARPNRTTTVGVIDSLVRMDLVLFSIKGDGMWAIGHSPHCNAGGVRPIAGQLAKHASMPAFEMSLPVSDPSTRVNAGVTPPDVGGRVREGRIRAREHHIHAPGSAIHARESRIHAREQCSHCRGCANHARGHARRERGLVASLRESRGFRRF